MDVLPVGGEASARLRALEARVAELERTVGIRREVAAAPEVAEPAAGSDGEDAALLAAVSALVGAEPAVSGEG